MCARLETSEPSRNFRSSWTGLPPAVKENSTRFPFSAEICNRSPLQPCTRPFRTIRCSCSLSPLLRQSALELRRNQTGLPPQPEATISVSICRAAFSDSPLRRSGLDLTLLSRPSGACVCALVFSDSPLRRSGLDLTPLPRPVRSRAQFHVLVVHLCIRSQGAEAAKQASEVPSKGRCQCASFSLRYINVGGLLGY